MRWYKARKVELYPFEVYLVNEGYVRGKSRHSKWTYSNTMFYYKNGFETSFRGMEDIENLKRFFRKNFNSEFVRKVGSEIKRNSDKILEMTKKVTKDKQALIKSWDEFLQSWYDFFVTFQLPHEVQNFLPKLNTRLLVKFGHCRDYAARKYLQAEQIYKKRLPKMLKLSREKALCLMPDEMMHYVKNGKLPADIHTRKNSLILTKNKKTRIFWNKKADVIFRREYIPEEKSYVTEIRGQPASRGKARGFAYIALNERHFRHIPKDCILICSMTRYNIVKHLKKVKAIVTDQGGIT